MRKKKISLFIVIVLTLMIAGCSSSNIVSSIEPAAMPDYYSGTNGYEYNMDDVYVESKDSISREIAPPMPPVIENEKGVFDGQLNKIITTVQINIESKEFDKSVNSLNELIKQTNSFVQYSNVGNNGYYSNQFRVANYTIRVPKENVDSFLSQSGSVGKVLSESVNREDVSEHYNDTESKLNVLVIKEERILALLEKADKMEDIIYLENTLNNIIYEKERLTGTLKGLDNKVNYSTININLTEVEKISNIETVETKYGEKVRNAFSDSWNIFVRELQDLTIILIYNLPRLIITLGITITAIILGRKYFYLKQKNDNKLS